jgi:hypothetical protein
MTAPEAHGHERRRHRRIGLDMPLEFSMVMMEAGKLLCIDFSGTGVDISEQGLGFITSFQLEPGLFIRVKQQDGSHQVAMVRWVGEVDGMYRVGVLVYN